ncbi:MAG: fructosamine kinase family protein [Pseudomonadota bacterium]
MSHAWAIIAKHIAETTGQPFQVESERAMGGGCINEAYLVAGAGQQYFVKLNSADAREMFEAEAEGLRELAASRAIRVPAPICGGVAGAQAYLVLEYVALGSGGKDGQQRLGEQLAALHRVQGKRFGWYRNNTIGATPQPNEYADDWCRFWQEHRIGFQLQRLAERGFGGRIQQRGERLLQAIPALLQGHRPTPSLLHGDLWSGNYAFDAHGAPVIFDPAVYYGDRETDLAMTELFGGFSPAFYQAYAAAFPFAEGYERRKVLYNLYHILNHANLFGGGYLGQAESMIDRLLASRH